MDGHDEANAAFRNFSKAPNYWGILSGNR